MDKNTQNKTPGHRSFLSCLFGQWQWTSPPWVQTAKKHPGFVFGILSLFLILSVSGFYALHWYQSRPKPVYVTAEITPPKITEVAETMQPDVLIIRFGLKNNDLLSSKSVAPLSQVGKAVASGIKMTPAMKGQWFWDSDHQLIFTPEEDWPAEQTFDIAFDKQLFASGVQMDKMDYSFQTRPFTAAISEYNFYQDPIHPDIHYAIATVLFNFPVDPESLQKNASFMMRELKNGNLNLDAKKYTFQITYDEHRRVAYIRSETIAIPAVSRSLVLNIDKGVKSASKTASTSEMISKTLLIPDVSVYFKVNAVNAAIVRNLKDRPEQILNVETTLGVTEAELQKALQVYVLPRDYNHMQNYSWKNPGEVTQTVLNQSKILELNPIPSERHYATLHSYQFSLPESGYLYIKINKGARSFGEYILTADFATVLKAPEFPKEISFLHKGALMALASEEKLSVLVRGLPAVKFSLARVLPENINQLITQTEGDFNNPYFINQSFNQQNISTLASEIHRFNQTDAASEQYTALDFQKYLHSDSNALGPHGLFLLEAQGWNEGNNAPEDARASRLVLITGMGLLVKDNSDGSHDVFVQSIITGAPEAGIDVVVLGKNGLPVMSRITDENGRASFPSLKDFVEEKEPVVYLASKGNDVSFIPFNHYNRQLNFSRFDVGGIYNNQDVGSLSAFIFSDRGIYRPGDTARLAVIVKQEFAKPQAAGLPVEAVVSDPRGNTVYDVKHTLNDTGFFSFDLPTEATSPTGEYYISLYTVKDEYSRNLIGSETIKFSEFLPDRMKISAALSASDKTGWVSPQDLTAEINLWNLFGAPAADRKVGGKIILSPQPVQFKQWPDYVFTDPLLDPAKPPKVLTDTLADVETDEKGQAKFKLNLEKYERATYQLQFYAEGFESGGGRSVFAKAEALVSPLGYLIGYKTDGNFDYVAQNSQHQVKFIAVDPMLKPLELNRLKIQLIALQPVATLVKKDNGTYQYQSVIQSKVINTSPFLIAQNGTPYSLSTDTIGDFALSVLDEHNLELSRVHFSVVGAGHAAVPKNAEMSVKLSQEKYHAAEDIQLQITAPYTGAGLITIERDRVYAAKWFSSETTSSVQTIHIPADFEGNGYVNVTFVRSWNSPEIFLSPLSYQVIPFEVSHENRDMKITLSTPEIAKPGDVFNIKYQSSESGKAVIYAVDEGILQVSRYSTPDPLAFFFQKRALEVLTQQTLDQILPQYIFEREKSLVGGDDGVDMLAHQLNPFKRKTDLPVVFWSGIVDIDSTQRQLQYTIPDYFNGKLRIMAVAVSQDSAGSTETAAAIRDNFVISPNVPAFVAPGDEFEITAGIYNNVKDSGPDANVAVTIETTSALEVLTPAKEFLNVPEGKEKTLRFKLKVKEVLGSADVIIKANLNHKFSSSKVSLSVRPATAFTSSIQSGSIKDAGKILAVNRVLYPEFREVKVVASGSPLILLTGLQQYLKNYPYGCTEQLISKVMPIMVLNDKEWLQTGAADGKKRIDQTIRMLSQRQMSSGAFSYWPEAGSVESNYFASVYAMHFLTEARNRGYEVSDQMFFSGISFLKDLASQTPEDLERARLQAYAVYLLTRNAVITTNYLTSLQLYLEKNYPNDWKQDISSAFMASTYKLLKDDQEAAKMIRLFNAGSNKKQENDFYDQSIANAEYLYLLAEHFPLQLKEKGAALVDSLTKALNPDEINTILSAFTILGFDVYSKSVDANGFQFSIADAAGQTLAVAENNVASAEIPDKVRQLKLNNPDKQTLFYQLIESGFEKNLLGGEIKNGMEIYREYRKAGASIDTAALGDEIEVHLKIRALSDRYFNHIAVTDLLPGGFEVAGEVQSDDAEYIDVREDRVVFFISIDGTVKELVYKIKAINAGTFTIPAPLAESMYDPALKARGSASSMTVTD